MENSLNARSDYPQADIGRFGYLNRMFGVKIQLVHPIRCIILLAVPIKSETIITEESDILFPQTAGKRRPMGRDWCTATAQWIFWLSSIVLNTTTYLWCLHDLQLG